MTAEPSIRPAPPATAVAAALAVMVTVAATARFGPSRGMLVAGPLGAAALLGVARYAGLGAGDVGLARRTWRRGAAYAAVYIATVAAVYTVGARLPATRDAFLDERYRGGLGAAALTAFVVIPLGTVLFEEVAFRGVLWGLLCRRSGPLRATLVSSGLFGLWHVLPSLRLNQVNPAVTGLVGPGPGGRVLAVSAAVLFTAAAGVLLCELRRRSGSLLAPMGLHWAVNGLGVLTAAGMAR